MVLCDEVLDDLGQVSILGKFQSVGHVVDDNLGAVFRTHQVVVRILTDLVLGEESGILGFAHIMVEGTGTHELHVGADFECCFTTQVGHLQRVLEGAGAVGGQLAQQRVIDVGEFK